MGADRVLHSFGEVAQQVPGVRHLPGLRSPTPGHDLHDRRGAEQPADEASRSKATAVREDVRPGSQARIDYGFQGRWTNPATGKRHRNLGLRDGAARLAAHVRAARRCT
jgi:hypothetical protein